MLGAWYLVWVLPLAWALPRVARRAIVILCVAFTCTELVTENTRLPDLIRSVNLPIGHPVAMIVCAWIAVDLIRRFTRRIPLDAETDERQFGDAFESGPAHRAPASPAETREPPVDDGPSVVPTEVPQPGGSLIPLRLARRR